MAILKVKLTYLLLLLCVKHCESLIDSSVPEIFFPFGTDAADSVVTPGSNQCDGPITIPYTIFGYRRIYVCTTGVVSFGSPINQSSGSIPRHTGPPFIAVNWHSFRTYNNSDYNRGRVYYRLRTPEHPLRTMTSRVVQHALWTSGFQDFQPSWVLVVTWHNVSTSSTSTQKSTFQLVLASNGYDHAMLLQYGDVDIKGTFGFDVRDGTNYVTIPSADVPSGTNACRSGRWVYPASTDVRVGLAGSGYSYKGRLEVKHNGYFSTVCTDGFDDTDASVFCYELGFGYNGQELGNRWFSNSLHTWLDNVACNGRETHFTQCAHRGWGIHDCSRNTDVAISCFYYVHYERAVRLVGGRSPREGRVELLRNGVWGTVCDTSFTDTDARVFCSMLGLGRIGRFENNKFGSGSGTIWLDSVQCSGSESSINSCQHRGWGIHGCTHSQDVSISCYLYQSSMRLVGPNAGKAEGRLEIYQNGTWGTVCDNGFTDKAAKVACNGLGFGYVGRVLQDVHVPGTGPIWLDNVACQDACLPDLNHCYHNGWGSHNCEHHQDVYIACHDNAITDEPTTVTTTPTASSTMEHQSTNPTTTSFISPLIQTTTDSKYSSSQTTVDLKSGSPQTTMDSKYSSSQTTMDLKSSTPQTTVDSKYSSPQTTVDSKSGLPQTTMDLKYSSSQTTMDLKSGSPQTTMDSKSTTPQTTMDSKSGLPQTTMDSKSGSPQTTVDSKSSTPQTTMDSKSGSPQTTVDFKYSSRQTTVSSKASSTQTTTNSNSGSPHSKIDHLTPIIITAIVVGGVLLGLIVIVICVIIVVNSRYKHMNRQADREMAMVSTNNNAFDGENTNPQAASDNAFNEHEKPSAADAGEVDGKDGVSESHRL